MMRDLNNISKDMLMCGCADVRTIKDGDENDVTVTRPLFPLYTYKRSCNVTYRPGQVRHHHFPVRPSRTRAYKNGAKYFCFILFCFVLFFSNQISPLFSERKPANVKQENELAEKRERIISCCEGRGNGVSHVSKAT
jgi:hypothetical protein